MKKQKLLIAIGMLLCIPGLKAQVMSVNMRKDHIHTCFAQFYDGGGKSQNYQNNVNDTLIISPIDSLTQKICVTFHSFKTQLANDFLYIYNGRAAAGSPIVNLNGTNNYGTIKSTAADGSLTFVFQSDALTNDEGWYATITTDTVPEEITMIANASWHVSTGRFYDSGGPIANYRDGDQTTVTLFPKNPSDKLSITFVDCNITAGDNLYVFNGNNLSAPLIGTINGQNFGTIKSSASDGSLTFQFQSNSTGNNSGWIAYIETNSDPEDILALANSTFTVSNGKFYDSGGPSSNYTDNKNVTITLLPENASDKVCVNFFQLELSVGDNLYVYDGDNSSAPLLATLTGSNFGAVRSSAVNGALTFVFQSDASSTNAGWAAIISTSEDPMEDITMMARGTFVARCGGRFFDNGGPSLDYGSNQNVVTTLFPENSSDKLTLNFNRFSTQAGTDILYIYDGNDTTAALIGTYSGALNQFSVTSTATDGSLTFKFVSNQSSNSFGWEATIACISGLPSYNMSASATYTTNGAYFYDSGGPNGNYSNNETSIVTFSPVSSGDKLSVSFTYFQTYDINDYLEIHDGASAFDPLLAKVYMYGAYGTITASATNVSGSLTFKFVSNNITVGTGWAALISTNITPLNFAQPGSYVLPAGKTGYIFDDAGPYNQYSNSMDYSLTISPQNSSDRLSVMFTYFETYDGNDYLEVHDGTSILDPIIATLKQYSGYGTITASSSNPTGSLTFRYVTNNITMNRGWAGMVFTNASPGLISQPGTYVTNSGLFTDPGGIYNQYYNNLDGVTTIKPQNSSDKISVTFLNFQTYNSADYLEIHDGSSILDPLITTMHTSQGASVVSASQSNSSGALTFRFVSDNITLGTGYAAVISTTPENKNFTLPGTYILPTGGSGFTYDVGGPAFDYNTNQRTVLTFKPEDQVNGRITLSFNSFNTYNSADNLSIYDGPDTNAVLLGTFHSSTDPGSFRSSAADGSLTLKFMSDNIANRSGWVAAISGEDCVSGSVGIEEKPATDKLMMIYPNPGSGNVNLLLSPITLGGDLIIYNLAGENVYQQTISRRDINLNLDQPEGIYFITLQKDGVLSSGKLIIQ